MINITIAYNPDAADTTQATPREIGLYAEDFAREFPYRNPALIISFDNSNRDQVFGTEIDLQTAISLRNGLNQFIHEAEIAEQRWYEREVRRGVSEDFK